VAPRAGRERGGSRVSLTLVTGGTRSGKSLRAEALAGASGLPVRYVATADPRDSSMAHRIDAHVARRPVEWTTVQANGTLADAFGPDDGACVLVDGLGAWLARVLHEGGAFADDVALARVRHAVLGDVDAMVAASAQRCLIVVAEEAGQGLLPMERGSRAWLDLLGDAVQRLAAKAQRVELVVAGRPLLVVGAPVAVDGLRSHGDRLVRPGQADHAVTVVAGGPPPWLR